MGMVWEDTTTNIHTPQEIRTMAVTVSTTTTTDDDWVGPATTTTTTTTIAIMDRRPDAVQVVDTVVMATVGWVGIVTMATAAMAVTADMAIPMVDTDPTTITIRQMPMVTAATTDPPSTPGMNDRELLDTTTMTTATTTIITKRSKSR